jgi:hypothetical protein
MVTLLAPMVTMPCEFTLPGAPQGPISESRIVTLRTPLTTMHEPLLVLTCTFSITWPSLAMICPLTALPAIVTGVGPGPGEMLFGALAVEPAGVVAAAARESVSEQLASPRTAMPAQPLSWIQDAERMMPLHA